VSLRLRSASSWWRRGWAAKWMVISCIRRGPRGEVVAWWISSIVGRRTRGRSVKGMCRCSGVWAGWRSREPGRIWWVVVISASWSSGSGRVVTSRIVTLSSGVRGGGARRRRRSWNAVDSVSRVVGSWRRHTAGWCWLLCWEVTWVAAAVCIEWRWRRLFEVHFLVICLYARWRRWKEVEEEKSEDAPKLAASRL
jgi:hypothetical protein